MVVMRISWAVLEIILVCLVLCFGSSAALALAAVMILIPLMSAGINLYIRNRITVTLLTEPNIRKSQTGIVTAVIKNPTIFPVFCMQCRFNTENQLNRQKQQIHMVTKIPWKGQRELRMEVGSCYCGRIKISLLKTSIYDCFGLIGVGCPAETVSYVTVQPDTFDMNTMVLPHSGLLDESDTYSDTKAGNDLTETYQIREYVPGDSMRQVHWKLSSKFDRMIVRDPALPIIQNVLVFWERTNESENMDMIDAQAETVVSLCKSLLENSIRFNIGWNDTDRNICIVHEISNTDELVGIVPRLMRATGSDAGVSGAELLLQTNPNALCSRIVYVANKAVDGAEALQNYGHVTMITGSGTKNAGAYIFDAHNYKEQLSQIDL